jgi:hypothetical protein
MTTKNLHKVVTDREADESIRPLEELPMEVATEFFNKTMMSNDVSQQARQSDILSPSELRLVQAVVKNPMRPSGEYPKLARISPNTFQKVRPGLVDKGFIREHRLESGGRGRTTILLEPLEAAIELVSAQNKPEDKE